MCGRFTLHTVREALVRRFEISLSDVELAPRYNIAPTQSVLAVVADADGARRATWMRWGLIPPWEPEPTTRLSTINARLETVAESRLYRGAFRRRRCLVLADGYYEWQAAQEPAPASGGARRRRAKQPYWIHREDSAPFAFAGLFSEWRPRGEREVEPVLSCAILTTQAFPELAQIHARMPVILRPDRESAWIDSAPREPEELSPLLSPDELDRLVWHPVRTLVNSPRRDGPELILDAPEAGF